jgi:hypothetical protein
MTDLIDDQNIMMVCAVDFSGRYAMIRKKVQERAARTETV